MKNIKIIEDLNKINYNIYLLEQEKQKKESEIEKLSIYKVEQIGRILIKLMTKFEGVEYKVDKYEAGFRFADYCLKPKDEYAYPHNNYMIFELDSLLSEHKNNSLYKNHEKEFCYLPPSYYYKTNNMFYETLERMNGYVQDFINYLFQKRLNESIYEITDEKLEELLQEYLENTKDNQQQRKNDINETLKYKTKSLKKL